jgi:sortase A
VARQKPAKDLTVEELRQLLIEKRRAERQTRLANYRRTGRVVVLESDHEPATLDSLRSTMLNDEAEYTGSTRSARRVWLDRLLVLVEISAVIGLMFVLFNGFNLLQNLNEEVAIALVMPTLTPTPLVQAVVLPSGHTPPGSSGGVQPNDAEIPDHLQPMVQTLANLPLPTAGPQQAVRIQISAIGIDAPVVQGDGWEQLKKGVGQHAGSPNPGENGNIVLSAHNDVFGELFRDLDQLKPGDKIVLFNSQRSYTYIVQNTQLVEPTQVEVMAPTKEPVVTLISCYPYMVDDQRIVVTAYIDKQT